MSGTGMSDPDATGEMDAADLPTGDEARCASCGEALVPGDQFCEACGAITSAGAAAGVPMEGTAPQAPTTGAGQQLPPNGAGMGRPDTTCAACGGRIVDGYCDSCGVKAPTARDHWTEAPASWVGGVCDRGIVHARNEDAMALAATDDGSLAVLVVCDGVTSAPDSDRASLAAARAACQNLLSAGLTIPAGTTAAAVDGWADALIAAAAAANTEAVGVARILGNPPEPPSCTFVAAAVARSGDRALVSVGWCGDSRAYWVPDVGPSVQLGRDHSLGTEMIDAGATVAEAEADPTSHTITRWLGADSVNATPELLSLQVDSSGWLAVVSDGMWNYASSPEAFTAVLRASVDGDDPVKTAEAMVAVANGHGGHDNITVALARLDFDDVPTTTQPST